MAGKYYDDFEVGDRFQHSLGRTVTERALFTSGDEDSQEAAVASLTRQLTALARPPDGVRRDDSLALAIPPHGAVPR